MRSRLFAFGLLLILGCSVLPAHGVLAADENAHALVTRGEMLQSLLDGREESRKRVEWQRAHLSRLPLFLDISRDDAIAPYAEAAFALRITSGFSDRTLRPGDPIPVEEAITLLMRTYKQEGEPADGDAAWYAPFIRGALRRNLIANPPSIRVGQPLTRGQFADMAERMQAVIRDGLAAFPGPMQMAGRGAVTGASVRTDTEHVQDQPREIGAVHVARVTDNQETLEQFRSSRDFAITIPSLGIADLLISHPADPQSKEGLLAPLRDGVGHLFSYPGRGGKIMVYGHSSGYAWDVSQYTKIFRQVNRLKKGDRVYVTFSGNLYEYEVTGQQTISPTDAKPFTGEGEELILYTCWPPNSIKKRLIVRAVPVETVAVR